MTIRRRRDSAAARRAGFSLLEMLVALALLATLTVILVSALQFGTQVWHRGDPAAAGADLLAAYRTLQTNIERALPIPEPTEQANVTLMAFDGTADDVTFVVANPGRVGVLGDTVLHLARGTGNGGQFLGISWAPYDPKRRLAIEAYTETLTLLPDVRAVSFRYFGARDEDGAPPRWSDEWRRQTTLPRLIGIEIETGDGRKRSWSFRVSDGG
jgi:prepilin-type N-terminal cleavage/methylation domain-containing protein